MPARIALVENSLMPYVPVAGLPGWNLRERMKFHRVPGLSIAVVRNYRVEWAKGYGLADTTARTPVTPQTLFSAGSISKLVAAGAALALVQEGKISLDAPINTHLKSWQLADNDFTRQRAVTLRLLLGHQGGTSQSVYFGFVPRPAPLPSVLAIVSGQPGAESRPVVVNKLPGSGFQYWGGGYLLAQLALMDATGQSFTALAERLLFRPLGMSSSTFAQPLPARLQARAAWAYSENSWFKGMPYVYPQQAPAGLYATPRDLACYLIEVQQAYRGKGKVLAQGSAQAMLTPQAEVSDGTYREQMGLGAFLLQRADRHDEASRYFEHTDVNAGFLAYAMGSVVGGNGLVIMMNNNNGADELGKELRRAVARVYNWPDFLPPPLHPAPVAPAALAAAAGRYQRGPDDVLTFRPAGDHWLETINAGSPILAYPAGGDTVAFTDFPLRGTFGRDGSGQIVSFRMLGADNLMPRLPPPQLLPNELLRLGRVPEAVAGYRLLHLNEYQLTYMAYDLLAQRPTPLAAVQGLLGLALEQYPQSGIVQSPWGDYYLAVNDKVKARIAYQAALQQNPDDKELLEKLAKLGQP